MENFKEIVEQTKVARSRYLEQKKELQWVEGLLFMEKDTTSVELINACREKCDERFDILQRHGEELKRSVEKIVAILLLTEDECCECKKRKIFK